jgi:hypothetical protein
MRKKMLKYKVVMEITIADTDAPPSDWLPNVIQQVCEDDETVELIECKELSCVDTE